MTEYIPPQLEKYDKTHKRCTRYTCPRCGGKKCFTRYINPATGEYIADDVGRCDHESSCGYHKKPREYFEEQGGREPKPIDPEQLVRYQKQLAEEQERERRRYADPDYIDMKIIKAQQSLLHGSNFFKWLSSIVGSRAAIQSCERYKAGATRSGWMVYPQIDTAGRCRTAKIMQYGDDGHRVKTDAGDRVRWLHNWIDRREQNNHRESGLLHKKDKDFLYAQCWFGSHLITPDTTEVHVVEGEKTALIMSAVIPEFTWLATGGKNYFSPKYAPPSIENIKIIIWCDADAVAVWVDAVKKWGWNYAVSDWYKWDGVSDKMDIADYYVMKLMPTTAAPTTAQTKTTETTTAAQTTETTTTETTTTETTTETAPTVIVRATVFPMSKVKVALYTLTAADTMQPKAQEGMPFAPTMTERQWQELERFGLAF